jgi:protein SCO1/2
MNRILRRRAWATAAVLLLLVMAGAAWYLAAAAPPRGNLSDSAIDGRFALVDETGRPVTEQSYAGRWRLIYFGYTWCPDICPTDTAEIAAGLKAFEKAEPERAARVQPLFLSFDPARDTPAVLAEFTDHFHPRLVGLTGSPAQVAAALKGFRIYATRVEGATPGSYTFDHVAIVYLMDPDGRPVEFLARPNARTVAAMLERIVR